MLAAFLLVGASFAPAPTPRTTALGLRPLVARAAVLRLEAAAPEATLAVAEEGTAAPAAAEEGKVAPTRQKVGSSSCSAVNANLLKCDSARAVLQLVEDNFDSLNAVNLATALHRLAVINKTRRAKRDAMLRDRRFTRLMEAISEHNAELNARSVADVLWSLATLQHWPAPLLVPVLTAVNAELDKETFEAQHLATTTWALAKLETKPVRLLEKIEAQATARLGEMSFQNIANLLWGFATLKYQPSTLLPKLEGALTPEMLVKAKPVEIANLAFALSELLPKPHTEHDLLLALARVAAPDGALPNFSSRQLVALIRAYAALEMAAALPEGLLKTWVKAVRAAHEARPLIVADARALEASLESLGVDATWIKRSEMLNAWIQSVDGSGGRRPSRAYAEEELRTVFDSIDADQSGAIDVDELRTAIRALKKTSDDAAVEQMLALADADGSGSIDFDEFKELMSLRRRDAV